MLIEAHEGDLLGGVDAQAGLNVQRDVFQPQARVVLDADRRAAIPGRGKANAARGEADCFIAFGFPRGAGAVHFQ